MKKSKIIKLNFEVAKEHYREAEKYRYQDKFEEAAISYTNSANHYMKETDKIKGDITHLWNSALIPAIQSFVLAGENYSKVNMFEKAALSYMEAYNKYYITHHLSDETGIQYCINAAEFYFKANKLDEAASAYSCAKMNFFSNSNLKNAAIYSSKAAEFYFKANKLDEAVHEYAEAGHYSELAEMKEIAARNYMLAAQVSISSPSPYYQYMTTSYYHQAAECYYKDGKYKDAAHCYLTMSEIELSQGNFEKAIFNHALYSWCLPKHQFTIGYAALIGAVSYYLFDSLLNNLYTQETHSENVKQNQNVGLMGMAVTLYGVGKVIAPNLYKLYKSWSNSSQQEGYDEVNNDRNNQLFIHENQEALLGESSSFLDS
jgi:tetratricopeptide (TPR) repeat protein